MTSHVHIPARTPLPRLLATTALAAAFSAAAQYADLDRADWKEDAPPPPPAYSVQQLIEIEMPRSSTVEMGIDPETITLNHDTGVVRYVVVARGPSAVNATYEGIRQRPAERMAGQQDRLVGRRINGCVKGHGKRHAVVLPLTIHDRQVDQRQYRFVELAYQAWP